MQMKDQYIDSPLCYYKLKQIVLYPMKPQIRDCDHLYILILYAEVGLSAKFTNLCETLAIHFVVGNLLNDSDMQHHICQRIAIAWGQAL